MFYKGDSLIVNLELRYFIKLFIMF